MYDRSTKSQSFFKIRLKIKLVPIKLINVLIATPNAIATGTLISGSSFKVSSVASTISGAIIEDAIKMVIPTATAVKIPVSYTHLTLPTKA